MKTRRTLTASNVALALALIALKPVLNADPVVENARDEAAASEVFASERKLALAEIDAQIAAIEHSLHQAPDAATRDAARVRLDELKKRRADLRKNYVAAKAAELRADANLEYRKAVAWTKGTIADVKDTVTGTKPTTPDTVATPTTREAGDAAARLALYKLDPSPDNKAEVKTALEALDDEVDRLEDYADDMPKGPERDALRKRVRALEARKDALESDFNRARWNAVVADLKSEWDRIAN